MAKRLQGLVAALLLAGLARDVHAAGQARVEVPILRRTLSDGVVRYAVALTIGGENVEAGLDTGSTGLRLMPLTAPLDVTKRHETYAYSGGVKLDGVLAYADVSLGAMERRIRLLATSQVGCAAERPRCSARSLPLASFGFMGDGLAGEGFKAVLGLGLAGKAAENPLRALGAQRWIISLPRTDEPGSGRLVINPSDSDIADFILLPLLPRLAWRNDAAHDAVEGRLENRAHAWTLCAPVLLDTGADRITLVNADVPAGVLGPVTFAFPGVPGAEIPAPGQPKGLVAIVNRLDLSMPKPIILAGATPYLSYDVLYDAERGAIGLRPRGF